MPYIRRRISFRRRHPAWSDRRGRLRRVLRRLFPDRPYLPVRTISFRFDLLPCNTCRLDRVSYADATKCLDHVRQYVYGHTRRYRIARRVRIGFILLSSVSFGKPSVFAKIRQIFCVPLLRLTATTTNPSNIQIWWSSVGRRRREMYTFVAASAKPFLILRF